MQETYTIISYTDEKKAAWDTFGIQAKNATFLFRRDFMEYHKERFEDGSVLIYKSDKLVAILPANQSGDTIYSHQGLTYGGLVLAPKAKLVDVIEIFKALLQYLEAKGCKKLIVKQLPVFYASQPSEELDYISFLLKAKLTRLDTASVIDYRNPIAIQSNRIEGVKKANKVGLVIKEESQFEDFWNKILLPNLASKHQAKPTHTVNEIIYLHRNFPKNIRQFNVYANDQIVGGATIFETETTAHVQYISGNDQKQELGTLDFLFDHLIRDVFGHKRYFDFGISNEAGGLKLNKGLSYWKECFGAHTYVHRFYEIETSNHKLLDTVYL